MLELQELTTQVRRDILRMVHKVNSGHPGGSLGCAEFLVVLYNKIMDRKDSFEMNGHGEDHCMRWMGICERSFDLMCKRAVSRELADGQTLADKQTIQNWIAESRAEINAARLLIKDAAFKIDTQGAYKTRNEISIIKFYAANVMQNVVDRAIQVHGALGITDDTILAAYYRHERASRIYDGADEVHKSRLARQILKTYKVV